MFYKETALSQTLPKKLKEILEKKQSLNPKSINFTRRAKLKCQFREVNLTHVFQKLVSYTEKNCAAIRQIAHMSPAGTPVANEPPLRNEPNPRFRLQAKKPCTFVMTIRRTLVLRPTSSPSQRWPSLENLGLESAAPGRPRGGRPFR